MISTAPKQTTFGKIAETRALGGDTLTFTRFKIGNGELSPNTNPAELTDLINPLFEFPIEEIDKSNKGYVKVIGKFNSADIKSDFRWTELGLFCKINDEAEGVCAYGNDGKNAGMLKANVSDVVADTRIALVIEIGDAENVTAILSESVLYAPKTEFDNHVSDSKNPHNVTKEQVGLGNVPNVKTNDQTPTFSIASKLTELTSGEGLGVSFGKIARAIRSLISHLGDKNNPHGITTTTISAAEAEHTHSVTDINSGVLGEARGGTGVTSITKLFESVKLTGSPTAPTMKKDDNSTSIATTEFVQTIAKELSQQIDRIKSSIGNAYLGDVVEFLDIDIIHIQYGGHSEYDFYSYRCSGAKLKDGNYITNTSGKYADYGNRYSGGNLGNFYIGFNPDAIIVLPVTSVTLESCLYAGEANNTYKTTKVSEITGWMDEREEDDTTYAIYERTSISVYSS